MSTLTHRISGITVFASNDYDMFSMINGNRGLNASKISRIIKEIKSGNDMLRYYPIQVSVVEEKLKILDGQHRFFISKTLERDVYYIIVTEEKSMPDIAKVNSNVEKWTPKDFLNCYINQGISHYGRLQEFLDIYGLNIGLSCMLLTAGRPHIVGKFTEPKIEFEEGRFKVLHWEEAVELTELCKSFQPFEYWKDRPFMVAVDRIAKAGRVPMADIVAACQKYPELLVRQASQKQYVIKLEEVLNHRKQKRTIII